MNVNSHNKQYKVAIVVFAAVLFIIIIIILLFYLKYNNGSMSTYLKITERQTFSSDYGGFKVNVPKEWKCENNPFIEATADEEGTPDAGMQINIDDESFIYIIVSCSRIYYNGMPQKCFKTNDGLVVVPYSYGKAGVISQVKFTDFIGVNVRVSSDTYNKYKKEIIDLIKSIKIKQ